MIWERALWAVSLFITPTLLAIALDFVLRAPSGARLPPREWLNYFGSSARERGASGGPLWLTSRLWPARRWPAKGRPLPHLGRVRRRSPPSRKGRSSTTVSFTTTWAPHGAPGVSPARYSARGCRRGVVSMGMRLGGHRACSPRTLYSCSRARRAARPARAAWTSLPIAGFVAGRRRVFWLLLLSRRSLQAAPPNTPFIHGVMHALRGTRLSGKGWNILARHLQARARPAAAPRLASNHPAAAPPACCSSWRARDGWRLVAALGCKARFLDEVAPDRLALELAPRSRRAPSPRCA